MKLFSVAAMACAILYGALFCSLYLDLAPMAQETVFATSQYYFKRFAVVVYGLGALLFFWVAWTFWSLRWPRFE